jgi:hypothetical protein
MSLPTRRGNRKSGARDPIPILMDIDRVPYFLTPGVTSGQWLGGPTVTKNGYG